MPCFASHVHSLFGEERPGQDSLEIFGLWSWRALASFDQDLSLGSDCCCLAKVHLFSDGGGQACA